MEKKFIVTKDGQVATKFIAAGLQLVSEIAGVYTFVNKIPKNFTFDEIDKTKYCFTNKLHL